MAAASMQAVPELVWAVGVLSPTPRTQRDSLVSVPRLRKKTKHLDAIEARTPGPHLPGIRRLRVGVPSDYNSHSQGLQVSKEMELSVSLSRSASQAANAFTAQGVLFPSQTHSTFKEQNGGRPFGDLPICPCICARRRREDVGRPVFREVFVGGHVVGKETGRAWAVHCAEPHNSWLSASFNPLPGRRPTAMALHRRPLERSFSSTANLITPLQSATRSCGTAPTQDGPTASKSSTKPFLCYESRLRDHQELQWLSWGAPLSARPLQCKHLSGPRWRIASGLKLDEKMSAGPGNEDVFPSAAEAAQEGALVGEDAAVFSLETQSLKSWGIFSTILATVLAVTYYVWIDSNVGLGYGGKFIQTMSLVSDNHELVMLAILFVFAIVHSGLAALRSSGEELMGERAYRVLFASASLPLSIAAVVYFINHRYDGVQLWQLRTVPGIHELVWLLSFISFFFLYPSTFNLLEVAAVDRPKLHLWETGIMRITRHPQMVGQLIWCLAHTLWIGNSFTLTTSLGLCAHHLFGCWHGDKRLAERYGEAFERVRDRTSIFPFAAIVDGRQKLPKEYWREFLRVPYLTITALTLGAYFCHPLMQMASFHLHW
ncbi:hypothetical protein CBR_g17600 [Chara braunii]|uniref:NnrU domain-containing protein n=1 Tax=Chara braunii TaxID=69332 RepID=A0A388KV62_CHABU|nr:hypothetical protein CBR_g17600 [Chara braunii]|eukprot:GBG73888.1 hypothetical protein CBR_g17600 [Chara braunii]